MPVGVIRRLRLGHTLVKDDKDSYSIDLTKFRHKYAARSQSHGHFSSPCTSGEICRSSRLRQDLALLWTWAAWIRTLSQMPTLAPHQALRWIESHSVDHERLQIDRADVECVSPPYGMSFEHPIFFCHLLSRIIVQLPHADRSWTGFRMGGK